MKRYFSIRTLLLVVVMLGGLSTKLYADDASDAYFTVKHGKGDVQVFATAVYASSNEAWIDVIKHINALEESDVQDTVFIYGNFTDLTPAVIDNANADVVFATPSLNTVRKLEGSTSATTKSTADSEPRAFLDIKQGKVTIYSGYYTYNKDNMPIIRVGDDATFSMEHGQLTNSSGYSVVCKGTVNIKGGTLNSKYDVYHTTGQINLMGGTYNCKNTSNYSYSRFQESTYTLNDCVPAGYVLQSPNKTTKGSNAKYTSVKRSVLKTKTSYNVEFKMTNCTSHNMSVYTKIDGDEEKHIVSCKNCNGEKQMAHAYNEYVIKQFTCTEDGKRHDVCQCGYERDVVVPAHHIWVESDSIIPTCTHPGMKSYIYCEVCGEVKQQATEIPQLKHKFTYYEKSEEQSCLTGYTYTSQCDYGCGTEHSYTDVDKGASAYDTHDWGEWVSDNNVTCRSYGTKTRHCKRPGCKGKQTEEDTSIAKPEHVFEEHPTVYPTCEENGHRWYIQCKNCGYCLIAKVPDYGFYPENEQDIFDYFGTMASGHIYSVKEAKPEALLEAATCEHGNIYRTSCYRCGKVNPVTVDSEGNTEGFDDGNRLKHEYYVQAVSTNEKVIKDYYMTAYGWDYTPIPESVICIIRCRQNGCQYYEQYFADKYMHEIKLDKIITAPTCQNGYGHYKGQLLGGTGFKYEFLTFEYDNYVVPELEEDGTFKTHASDDDGYCPYHDYQSVAMVTDDEGNNSFYTNFDYAWKAAYDGYTITLLDDLKVTKDYDSYKKNITIDLNGFTLDGRYYDSYSERDSYHTLNLGSSNTKYYIKNGTAYVNISSGAMENYDTLFVDNATLITDNLFLYNGGFSVKNYGTIKCYIYCFTSFYEMDHTSHVEFIDLWSFSGYPQDIYDENGILVEQYYPAQTLLHYLDNDRYYLDTTQDGCSMASPKIMERSLTEGKADQQVGTFALYGGTATEHNYASYSDNGDGTHRGTCTTCGRIDFHQAETHRMSQDGTHCLDCDMAYHVRRNDGSLFVTLGQAVEGTEEESLSVTLLSDFNEYDLRNGKYYATEYCDKNLTIDLNGHSFKGSIKRSDDCRDYELSILNSSSDSAYCEGLYLDNDETVVHIGPNIEFGEFMYQESIDIMDYLKSGKITLDRCITSFTPGDYENSLDNVYFNNPDHTFDGYFYNTEVESMELICKYCGHLADRQLRNEQETFDLTSMEIADGKACYYPSEIQAATLNYKRSFTDAGVWQSLYVPFGITVGALEQAGMEAAVINQFHRTDTNDDGEYDTWYMEVRRVSDPTASLRPNTPYVIRLKNGANAHEPATLQLTDVSVKPTQQNSKTLKSMDYNYTFTGNYEQQESLEDTYAISEEGVIEQTDELAPQRWSLGITNNATQEVVDDLNVRIFILSTDEDGTPTDISEMGRMMQPIKGIYNAMGVKTNRMQHGVNILQLEDGSTQKFIVK